MKKTKEQLILCSCRYPVPFEEPAMVTAPMLVVHICPNRGCNKPVTHIWYPPKEKTWVSFLEIY